MLPLVQVSRIYSIVFHNDITEYLRTGQRTGDCEQAELEEEVLDLLGLTHKAVRST